MMMSFLVALLVQAAATSPWAPPIQAAWAGDGGYIRARMLTSDKPISMQDVTDLKVVLSSDNLDFRVSPFINMTRGIVLEIVDQSGEKVAAREPLAASPPAPPLEEGKLTAVTPGMPMEISIRERAASVFPRPGRYRVRAVINLMNINAVRLTYKKSRTDYVDVEVTV